MTLARGSIARPAAYLAAGVTIVLWGASYAIIRMALQSFGPTQLAALSFLVASIVFAVYAFSTRMHLPSRSDLFRCFLAGGIGISLYNVLLNVGEVTVSAGAASFLINCGPVFAALLGFFLLGERLRPAGWIAILVSFCGLALIASTGSGGMRFGKGALLIIAAAACAAIQFYLQKPLLKTYTPTLVTAYMIWAGTLILSPVLPSALSVMRHASMSGIAAMVFVGVFPAALAYATWSMVLASFPLGRAVGFLYLIPPFAMLFSWVWLREIPAPRSLMGGALALAGVIVLNRFGRITITPE